MSGIGLRFEPAHDENARQEFVGALKAYTNMIVQPRLEQMMEADIIGRIRSETGKKKLRRQDIEAECRELPLFAFWANLTFHSQDLLFETVGETVERTREEQELHARTLTSSARKLGSLHLDPEMKISPPIAQVEIHRQPGGYVASRNDDDLSAARIYSGTIEIYRNAKAMGDGSTAGSDSIGHFTAATVKRYFPDLRAQRILDMGCGTGEQTVAFRKAFPEATVFGLDTAGPLLRYAHAWAEDQKLEIHYRQANAQNTGFEDGSFDLIVSHILFHETSRQIMPRIMKEAYRLLSPGGVFLNLDVPYQPDVTPLPRQVTNNWQVINNGEPFFTGFAETKLQPLLSKAGFAAEQIFHNYETFGNGRYLVFGGRK